jgi:hypothetical protein
MRTGAAAVGDLVFCYILAAMKTWRAKGPGQRIWFCAAVVPDAHLYAAPECFVEVAHGVIHFGHPSLFNLERAQTLFIVPDEPTKKLCEENTTSGQFAVDARFFRSFFRLNPTGEKVFVAQPGEPFEQIAERFLAQRPEWKVRPHPRSSAQFISLFQGRIEMNPDVRALASISSTMLNEAALFAIPTIVVRSSIPSENGKLETSFEGLTLPAQYEVVYA